MAEKQQINKLLPCPFCGREALLAVFPSGYAKIGCNTSDCIGGMHNRTQLWINAEIAMLEWNKRIPNKSMQATGNSGDAKSKATARV